MTVMQAEVLSPLSLDEEALLCSGIWENRLGWFPVVGWLIAGLMQAGRLERAILAVHDQLERRDCFPTEAWDDVGVASADAERVALAIADRLALPNHHFLPEDPLRLLLLDIDSLGYLEAKFAIGEELGVEVEISERLFHSTFGDFVRHVCANWTPDAAMRSSAEG